MFQEIQLKHSLIWIIRNIQHVKIYAMRLTFRG